MKLYQQYINEHLLLELSIPGLVWIKASDIFLNTQTKCLKDAGIIKRKQQQTIINCKNKGNLARFRAIVRLSQSMKNYCDNKDHPKDCKKQLIHMEKFYKKEIIKLKAKIKQLERI